MKISIVSSILGHGTILQDSGSALILLASTRGRNDDINVITWKRALDSTRDSFKSTKIYEVFDSNHALSIMRYFKILKRITSEIYIYNLMPTAYGNSSIANFVGLIMPLYTKKILRRNTVVIYHNSTYTNDPFKLGYTGFFNLIRYSVLKHVEKALFTGIETYFLTEAYRDILFSKLSKARVHTIHLPYFQVLDTLYLNELEDLEGISVTSGQIPRILLFGSWGPQKNPREALECLQELKKEGKAFRLTVAGSVNEHFPNLQESYEGMFDEFKDIIERRLQWVPEIEIVDLFTETDLVVIPYNSPGGFSSVLALSMFFERDAIISDFPEYREQAIEYNRKLFYKEGELCDKVKYYIDSLFVANNIVEVRIKERIDSMKREFYKFLDRQVQEPVQGSQDNKSIST